MSARIAVIGAGLGGLTAAIYLRLGGAHVRVFEGTDRGGGKAAALFENGYRLDPGPSIVILTRIYARVFHDAGRSMEDYLRFERLDPFTRVNFEGREPTDLPADAEACLGVLGREAEADLPALQRLLRSVDRVAPLIDATIFDHPIDSIWQLADPKLVRTALAFDFRRTYREIVDVSFRSPLLRAFFYGFPSYGGQTYDSKAPGALMIPWLMVREGVWRPVGGVGAIPRAFERLAKELGVEFHYGARVVGLHRAGRRVIEAELEGGERIQADGFVANVDPYTVASQWLGRTVAAPPSLSYFTVHWGLRRQMDGLSHHTLLIPRNFEMGFEDLYRRRRFPDPPIVYVNATHVEDREAAPPGCANVFAVVTSPAEEPGLDWSAPEHKQAVVHMMGRFGFSIGDVEVERIQTPSYFAQAHGNYRGSLYGVDERSRLWGMMPHRNIDSGYDNLFYCGGAAQPGAGMPMVVLSGRFAAEKALAARPRR